MGRPKGSGKGRTDALLVRFSPEELERVQREAARASQAASQRIRLSLAREAVLDAIRALNADEEQKMELAWVAIQDLSAGARERWLPAGLRAVERESTKAALDRVREAVRRLAAAEAEFFSGPKRSPSARGARRSRGR